MCDFKKIRWKIKIFFLSVNFLKQVTAEKMVDFAL